MTKGNICKHDDVGVIMCDVKALILPTNPGGAMSKDNEEMMG